MIGIKSQDIFNNIKQSEHLVQKVKKTKLLNNGSQRYKKPLYTPNPNIGQLIDIYV